MKLFFTWRFQDYAVGTSHNQRSCGNGFFFFFCSGIETQREVELLGEIKISETVLPRERNNDQVSQSGCQGLQPRAAGVSGMVWSCTWLASYSASPQGMCVLQEGKVVMWGKASGCPCLFNTVPALSLNILHPGLRKSGVPGTLECLVTTQVATRHQ